MLLTSKKNFLFSLDILLCSKGNFKRSGKIIKNGFRKHVETLMIIREWSRFSEDHGVNAFVKLNFLISNF